MTGGLSTHDEPTWVDGAPQGPRRRRRGRTGAALLVALGLLLVLGVGGWLAVRGVQAATSLVAVADGVTALRDRVASGDTTGLAQRAEAVRRDAARAAAATSDPVWRLGEALPVVGADAVAVRTVAHALDDLATDGLPPLVEVAGAVDASALRPVDGRIDLAPLVAAAPGLSTAAAAGERARAAVAGLDPADLHGPLPDAVAELQARLGEAAAALDVAATATEVLPSMLGAEGPRTYLALFLNSAELRTSGGIPGAIAVVTAHDGRIGLGAQESASNLLWLTEPALPLTPEELTIGTDRLGRMIQNTALVPDAPRSGELAAAIWRESTGQSVDGVLTADTVALSYLLRATGDIPHPDGSVLTADTLVQQLLFDAYARYPDPDDSDVFFAGAAAAVFDRLASGAADPVALVDGLRRAAGERRLSVWSAHAEEQSVIRGTAVDGALLSGGHDDAVGVFLDNASGWKTDTFLRTELTVESATCADGVATLELRLDLASDVPADVGSLPFYVVGDGSGGTRVPPGHIRQRVSVYSPVGGDVAAVRRGERTVGGVETRMAGRDVQVVTETLAPGDRASFTITVSGPAAGERIPLWSTPTTQRPGMASVPSPCR